MKKLILVLVTMFMFTNINAQGPSYNDEASSDINDGVPVLLFEEEETPSNKTNFTKELLVDIAKYILKKDGNDDYKLDVKVYCISLDTQPQFNSRGGVNSYTLYVEKKNKISIYIYKKGKVFLNDNINYPLKKQIPVKL